MNKRNDWRTLLDMANDSLCKMCDILICVNQIEVNGTYDILIENRDGSLESFASNYYEDELSEVINDAWAHVRAKVKHTHKQTKTPAPIDNKNVMTDWIENVFDNCDTTASRVGRQYVGFVDGAPVHAIYSSNRIRWTVLDTDSINVPQTIHELERRLLDCEDPDSSLFSQRVIDGNILFQSFFFRNED